MASNERPIIIVRKKKKATQEHHGGAWKVAYADFVTAMMAFFLVMWLVGQGKPIKQSIGSYFRDPGVFEYQRTHGLLKGGPTVENGPPPSAKAAAAERAALERTAQKIRDHLNE